MKITDDGRDDVRSDEGPARARQIPVPAEARGLSRLSRIDYADAFTVGYDDRTRVWSGERWARELVEEAPIEVRKGLRLGWTMLGLKLGPASARDLVLGWEVEPCGEDRVLLNAGSRIGMPAELLFVPRAEDLLMCTFIQQPNLLTRAIWWPMEGRHRRVVPRLLDRAAGARRAGRRPSGGADPENQGATLMSAGVRAGRMDSSREQVPSNPK